MKRLSTKSSSPDWRQLLKPKRGILKCAKRTDPKNHNHLGPFHNSDGVFWFCRALLGKGGFGSVFLADINGNFFTDSLSDNLLSHPPQITVKSSFLEHSSFLQFEKKVLDDLKSCSNVVRCYGDEVTTSESGNLVYNLLLEYCSRGNLYDRITKFGPNGLLELEVRRYTRDIVYGLAFIHRCGYIHCDIKPENILLVPSIDNEGCLMAKIADFGLAMKMTDVGTIDEEDGISGTISYLAPELVTDNYPDWPIDIWALGCVVLEMLTGNGAWGSKTSDPDLLTHIGYSNELPEIPNGLSPMAINFLSRCLIRNPNKRSPALLLLDHPLFVMFLEHF